MSDNGIEPIDTEPLFPLGRFYRIVYWFGLFLGLVIAPMLLTWWAITVLT
jgi:hypothetical protein